MGEWKVRRGRKKQELLPLPLCSGSVSLVPVVVGQAWSTLVPDSRNNAPELQNSPLPRPVAMSASSLKGLWVPHCPLAGLLALPSLYNQSLYPSPSVSNSLVVSVFLLDPNWYTGLRSWAAWIQGESCSGPHKGTLCQKRSVGKRLVFRTASVLPVQNHVSCCLWRL